MAFGRLLRFGFLRLAGGIARRGRRWSGVIKYAVAASRGLKRIRRILASASSRIYVSHSRSANLDYHRHYYCRAP